jgi:precorrin-3B C17-methyltransferase
MLGMITTVIVGNSSTFNYEGMMVNPRGYTSKYELIKLNQQQQQPPPPSAKQ